LQWDDFPFYLRTWIASYTCSGKKYSSGKIVQNKILFYFYFLSLSLFAFEGLYSPFSTASIFPVPFSFFTLFLGQAQV